MKPARIFRLAFALADAGVGRVLTRRCRCRAGLDPPMPSPPPQGAVLTPRCKSGCRAGFNPPIRIKAGQDPPYDTYAGLVLARHPHPASSRRHVSVNRRIWPLPRVIHISMLDRVEVNIF